MNEKELRKKIREKLNQNHEKQKKQSKSNISIDKQTSDKDLYHSENYHDYQKEAIIRATEEEICSQYPEMVECENHLGEIRWLTPLELNEEFEFYPLETSRFEKIKNRLFKSNRIEIPDTEEWQKFVDELRNEMHKDVQKRLARFKEKQAEAQKHSHSEIESQIYEEEIDKFYKAKKGYKKYNNHLGEFRWMTKEEAENQEEYYEEEPSLFVTRLFRLSILFGILIIIGSVWIYFAKSNSEPRGHLLLKGVENRGSLYIDRNLAVGFNYNIAYQIAIGSHEISVIRNGFITIPNQQQVFIEKNDTVALHFDFKEQTSATMGFIDVRSGSVDGCIYVNNEFYGNVFGRDLIALKAGEHSVRLEKEGYISNPIEQQFELGINDTTEITFSMRPRKGTRAQESEHAAAKLGLIEVRSNIKNADIYINSEKTEYKTDYVLQKMEYRQYAISVRKQGYQVYPEERVIKVNHENTRSVVSFTLSSTSNLAILRTQPIDGEIFINEKPVGSGEFRGSLPIGEHKISFGEVPFYSKPSDQNITIASDQANEYVFEYITNLNIEFSNKHIIPSSLGGQIISGHVFNNFDFIADNENGPELKSVQGINEKVWYLGYTFQYRNPSGSDALMFEITVPQHIDLSQSLNLKIWGYRSGSNYPIVVRGNAYYQIVVNGNTFREQVLPRYSIKEIREEHFDEFVVNDYLRSGRNRIFISTINNTSEKVALWKIAIQ